MATRFFKNLVNWQQDFEIYTDDSALLHDNFQFFISIFYSGENEQEIVDLTVDGIVLIVFVAAQLL